MNLSLEYCQKNLEYFDEGSSRIIFLLDDEWIIKKPIINGGVWQNKNEISLYKNYKNTTFPLCPINLELSNEETIVMKRASPLILNEDETLYDMFDTIWYSFFDDCELLNTKRKQQEFLSEYQNLDTKISSFYKNIMSFNPNIIKEKLYDICSFNCGIVDNSIVIIDYGYPDDGSNENVIDYYKKTEEYEKWFHDDLTDK